MAGPVIRSETYDALLTTTMHKLGRVIRDQITSSIRFTAWLEANGRMRKEGGGERIRVPLMYGHNTGADFFSGYGVLDTTPQDGITTAFFPWSQAAVPITISGLEKRQNRGSEQIVNLLRTKTMQSMASAQELYNNAVVAGRIQSGATGNLNQFVARTGRMDTSVSGPNPLAALIDAVPSRSVSVGEINGANDTWWRNKATASTASSYAAYKREKGNLYNECARGTGGPPDLIISDQLVWQVYFNSLQSQERYFVEDQRVINVLGGASDEQLKFRNAVHIWDEVVPDVGTSTANSVDGVGVSLQSGSHGTEYFINTETFEYIVDPQADWTQTEFRSAINQDASVAHLLWQGQVVINNRRKNGVMYDIDNTIDS